MVDDILNFLKWFCGILGALLAMFLGPMDGAIYALIIFVVLDYITGLIAAGVGKQISSEIGFKGIFKKVMIFCLVGVAHTVDWAVIQESTVFRSAVIFFYLANEGISILENAGKLGLPIPKKLKNILKQLKEETNDGDAHERT